MKGVYILILEVCKDLIVRVGSLGEMRFAKGRYAYVGSAQNNLEKRIERHRLKNKKKFWHIDYLTTNPYVRIVKFFYRNTRKLGECRIANNLSKIGIPIKDFGCSDCNCRSHLFRIGDLNGILELGVEEL